MLTASRQVPGFPALLPSCWDVWTQPPSPGSRGFLQESSSSSPQTKLSSPLVLSLLWLREERLGNSREIQQQQIKSSSLPLRSQSIFCCCFGRGKKKTKTPNTQPSRGTQNTRAVVFLSHVVIIISENSVQSKQSPFQCCSSATNCF